MEDDLLTTDWPVDNEAVAIFGVAGGDTVMRRGCLSTGCTTGERRSAACGWDGTAIVDRRRLETMLFFRSLIS